MTEVKYRSRKSRKVLLVLAGSSLCAFILAAELRFRRGQAAWSAARGGSTDNAAIHSRCEHTERMLFSKAWEEAAAAQKWCVSACPVVFVFVLHGV